MKKLMLGGLVALALASCADLSKYTKMATDLVGQFSPQIGDLLKQGQGLLDRTSALPQGTPGAGDVVKKLAANQTQLQNTMMNNGTQMMMKMMPTTSYSYTGTIK